jgi:uncharacterized integral membrane protein
MRKFLTTVVIIALFVLFVVFAVANRHDVTVSFDPFNSGDPVLTYTMPLFVLIIASVAAGVLVGGCATWIGQRRWRRAARQHRTDAETARTELANLKATVVPHGGSQRLPASFQPGPPPSLFGPYRRDKQDAAL